MRHERVGIVTSQAFSMVNFRGSLITDLVKLGVHVYALAPDYSDELRREVRELGAEPVDFTLSRAGLNPVSDLRGLISLVRALRRLRPDAVLTYFIKPVIYGSVAAAIARVRYRYAMIEGLGYIFMGDPTSRTRSRAAVCWVATMMYRIALSLNRKVFFLNEDDAQRFRGQGVVTAEQVVMLDGIGVDLADYRPRSDFCPPVTFVLVARMLRLKGVYDFVDAARIVRATHPGTRFLLVGGVDANPSSVPESDLRRWDAEGLVTWTGHVPDVRLWLAQSSVFVLPSFYGEGKPRSIQEAMACGLPIITTDSNGCRETVVHGVNGFLVPVRDPVALAQAMTTLIEDPPLISEFGAASRRMAEHRFDVHVTDEVILGALGYD